MKVLRQKPDGRWYWHWDPKFIDHGRTEAPREDFQQLFDAALANIRVPTLLVRGLLSDIVTEEGVQEFLARSPAPGSSTSAMPRTWSPATRTTSSRTPSSGFLDEDVRPSLVT